MKLKVQLTPYLRMTLNLSLKFFKKYVQSFSKQIDMTLMLCFYDKSNKEDLTFPSMSK